MSVINLKIALFFTLFIETESSDSPKPGFLEKEEEWSWTKFNPFVGPLYMDENLYGPENKNKLLDFDYQKETKWIEDKETGEIVDKKSECVGNIETDPQAAVNCFLKLNGDLIKDKEIFSVAIPEDLQRKFNEKYCMVTENNYEATALRLDLEEFVKNQIKKRYTLQEGEEVKATMWNPSTDLLQTDASNGINHNMNHFYKPRGKAIALDDRETRENAGPQPWHQDRSSLAFSPDSTHFLMLYTACAQSLDTARTGTWVSSASKDFYNTEKKCAKDASYEDCWASTKRGTYESGLYRAPRYTMGDDWTELKYISEEAERHIKSLKKFQQIPSVAGNVLVINERNVLHAGPETLPINHEALQQEPFMKRVVIRNRLEVVKPQRPEEVQDVQPQRQESTEVPYRYAEQLQLLMAFVDNPNEDTCKFWLEATGGDVEQAANGVMGVM